MWDWAIWAAFILGAPAGIAALRLLGDTPEVQESLERPRSSLARLAVLLPALDEAQVTTGGPTAVVPRR